MTLLLFPVLGVIAGVLTTVAGQGGGLVLLLALAALVGPHHALALTSPALLLGNLHRSILLRRYVDRPVAVRMIAGSLPGGLVGALLASTIPAWALRGLLVAMTALAIAKGLGLVRFVLPRRALVVAAFVGSVMTGTAGGGGVIFAPVLLSAGLSGSAFVATSSTIALATHVGRVAGYAALGLFERDLIAPTVALVLSVLVGNWAGDRARSAFVRPGLQRGLEHGMLVVCVALSVAGLG
jgi:hypothetical protein